MGVCERCDSMGVMERTKRSTVYSRPFDYAPFVSPFGSQGKQGKQSKVERAKIGGAKRPKPLRVNSDAPTGAGLKVGFNAEDTECAGSLSLSLKVKGKRDLWRTGDDHRKW